MWEESTLTFALSYASTRCSGGGQGKGLGRLLPGWCGHPSDDQLLLGPAEKYHPPPQTLLYVKSKSMVKGDDPPASSACKDYCFWKRGVSKRHLRMFGSYPLSTQGFPRMRADQKWLLKADDGVETLRKSLCHLSPTPSTKSSSPLLQKLEAWVQCQWGK